MMVRNYLDFLDDVCYAKKENDPREINEWVKSLNRLYPEQPNTASHNFVLDYTRHGYLLVKGNIVKSLGYNPMVLMEGGLDFTLTLIYKEDFILFVNKLFPAINSFLAKHAQESAKYIISFSFRAIKGDGSIVQVLQKCTYITNDNSLPLYAFGNVTDITFLKPDRSMVLSIDKIDDNGYFAKNITTQYFFPDPDDGNLSKRERHVLLHLADGLNSKEIASKLHLSDHTVLNHRKSILKKTNAKNVAQLIRYAIDYRLV